MFVFYCCNCLLCVIGVVFTVGQRTVERNRVKDDNFQVQQGMKGFSGNIKVSSTV